MFTVEKITVRPRADIIIDKAIEGAIQFSSTYNGCTIAFKFNGIECELNHLSDSGIAIKQFWNNEKVTGKEG